MCASTGTRPSSSPRACYIRVHVFTYSYTVMIYRLYTAQDARTLETERKAMVVYRHCSGHIRTHTHLHTRILYYILISGGARPRKNSCSADRHLLPLLFRRYASPSYTHNNNIIKYNNTRARSTYLYIYTYILYIHNNIYDTLVADNNLSGQPL